MSISITDFLSSELTEIPFYVLLGEKTDYSHSPLIHNTALEFHSIKAGYFALNISKQEIVLLNELFAHPNFKGANVTIPYKLTVKEYLSKMDEIAEKVGAVNVIKKEEDRSLTGYNTDVFGFVHPVKLAGINSPDRAVILGSGGASSAVVEAFQMLGTREIFMVSRKPDEVRRAGISVIGYEDLNTLEPVDAIVNATPVGMGTIIDESPVSAETLRHLNPDLAYDLIYKPQTTKFLQIAGSVGTRHVLGGLLMLVYQAAKAFEIWTDTAFPEELVFETLNATLID